ncbi:MAG: alpha/beta hydrolase, partial [Chloroflexi bacterium]|nr:alpha/beta hydrolase [Chloroflexota bacterium]
MALVLLFFWLPLICLVLLVADVGIIVEVARHALALPALIVATVVLVWLLVGRRLVLLIRRPAPDEPKAIASVRAHTLKTREKVSLFVDSVGPKEQFSLILCQGWEVTSDIWFYLKRSRRLERLGRISTWDLRGTGRSDAIAGPITLDALACDLREVVESEGARRVVLVGMGSGGLVVLNFARLFPDQLQRRILGLVLIDAPLQPLPAAPAPLRLAARFAGLFALLERLVYLSGLGHLVTSILSFGGAESRGQLELVTQAELKLSPRTVLAYVEATQGFDGSSVLPSIGVPVLLIQSA